MAIEYAANQSQFHFYIHNMNNTLFSVQQFKSQNLTLNQLYQFIIVLISNNAISTQDILGEPAKLIIDWGENPAYYHGYIENWQRLTKTNEEKHYVYQATLASPIYKLRHSKQSHTFVNQSIKDIIKTVIKNAEFSTNHYHLALKKKYPQLPMITQFNESNIIFLQQLFEKYGLFHFFCQDVNTWRWIITDSVEELPKFINKNILFEPQSGQIEKLERIYAFIHRCSYKKNHRFVIRTNCRGLKVGQSFQLKNHPIKENNTWYRVTAMKIEADQSLHKSLYTYQAECLLTSEINNPQTCILPVKTTSQQTFYTGLLPSLIVTEENEKTEHPSLDDKGFYLVKTPFNQTDFPQSKRLPLLQTTGKHFPLKSGTEVILAFNQSLQRPIIIGPISNSDHPTTVNNSNRYSHSLRTFGGNELLFNDGKDAEYLLIATKNHFNAIKFNNKKNNQRITFTSQKGKLEFYSGNHIIHKVGDSQFYSAKKYQINVAKQQALQTKKASIHHQAAKKIIYYAKQNYQIQSQKGDYQMIIHQNLTIKSQFTQQFTVQKSDLRCQSEAGKIILSAKRNCLIKNHNNAIISFTQPQGSVTIKNGNVNIKVLGAKFEAIEFNIHLPTGNVVSKP